MTFAAEPPPLPAWLKPVLRLRLWHLVLISLLLLSPALFSGFLGDDLLHRLMIRQELPLAPIDDYSLFNLFSFVDTNAARQAQLKNWSLLAWWASPDFSWSFWRPVAEISHYIDYAWLHYPWLMHLHSLLWFAALVVLVHRFFAIVLPTSTPQLLATALFALSGAHGLTVAWLSNRNALIASVFTLASFLLYHQFCQHKQLTRYLASWVFLALGLLAGEIAISIGAYLFFYAMWIDQDGPIKALLKLLPFLVIVIIWWSFYKIGGFGVGGQSSFYIAPLDRPGDFFPLAALRVPALVAAQFTAIPADILGNLQWQWPVPVIGLLLLIWGIRTFSSHPDFKRWLGLLIATLLACLPICASPPQDRNLMMVTIGSSALLAMVTYHWYCQRGKSRFATAGFWLFASMHFVVSPLTLLPLSYGPTLFSQGAANRAATLEVGPEDKVLVLGGDMMELVYLVPQRMNTDQPIPTSLVNLIGSKTPYQWQWAGDDTLLIQAEQGWLAAGDQLVRNLDFYPFAVGDKVNLSGLEILVTNINAIGQLTEIQVRLEDPTHWRLLQWTPTGYQPLDGERSGNGNG